MVAGWLLAALVVAAPSPTPFGSPRAPPGTAKYYESRAIGWRTGAMASGLLAITSTIVVGAATQPCTRDDCEGWGPALLGVVGVTGMLVALPATGAMTGVSAHYWGHYRAQSSDRLDSDRIDRRRSLGIVSLVAGWAAGLSAALVVRYSDRRPAHAVAVGVLCGSHVLRWIGLHAVVANQTIRRSPPLSVAPAPVFALGRPAPGMAVSGRF